MRVLMTGAALGLMCGLALASPAAADWPGGGGYSDDSGWSPRGSYRSTCGDVHVDGGSLEAKCRDREGDWRRTDLENFRECRGDIYNDDGHLRCRHGDDDRYGDDRRHDGDDHDRDWGRRGYGVITLYKHSNYRGASRSFNTDVPNLQSYGFADLASSANVQGGRWQLCTRPYYRGRCVTVDESVNNFEDLGINDHTESLRRVR